MNKLKVLKSSYSNRFREIDDVNLSSVNISNDGRYSFEFSSQHKYVYDVRYMHNEFPTITFFFDNEYQKAIKFILIGLKEVEYAGYTNTVNYTFDVIPKKHWYTVLLTPYAESVADKEVDFEVEEVVWEDK